MADIRLQQRQSLQLSAQQILSSQLLQLPMLNLEQRIYEELQENPLLEVVEESKESVGEVVAGSDGSNGDDMFDAVERFSKSALKERSDAPFSVEDSEGRLNFTYEGGSKERFFQAVQHDSFHDTLLRQLTLHEEVGEREARIAAEILGNLDGDGYFGEDYGVIVDSLHFDGLDISQREVEEVVRKIHFLDPPGIAVKDLRERFLVQLQAGSERYPSKTYEVATRILRDHFDDFLHRRFELLLKKLAETKEGVEAAVSAIIRLDPHPGIFQDEGGYITPDFLVSYENGALIAVLNDRSALSVKVTDRYQELLKNRKAPKEEKQFIRKNILRANEFTSAIETRRQTLLKVIEALMKRQYGFFVFGPERVVPLGMKTIAADTDLDISTISRAVNGKYVQTRFGVFELKYFFSTGLSTGEGEDLSSKVIRQQIADMISGEDSANPLSDESITEMLMKCGIHIARRTVAKYREQMQIPVARLRKKIF
ncbi:RNA polymerase factor sigma-54 [Pelodictyon phaeoclathratiforme]|jgi:RNA polymerase sigma-54 factor|uniref:RNA polymerase, sigma 54 subunit, RpoN n=1 Tax=Pelodictyon phaeoclathratiforme (strain DSM 5477 / BU-1) TaxID=324925 RepID=B4SGR6_PELPB|nr:RNA polymerase factor sigma-54 [Pelodictyon phaeoclathratiforme]ACF43479.1 RNA polymerase, sigma 54 subunit, RpoN [Pelodictyon phaeoclathratiforme BU-1]MBV5290193.1 RNA polymerase factor sigma-54 [Pelodictyon phaeoclathratiforme]